MNAAQCRAGNLVCGSCLGDVALAAWVKKNGLTGKCHYCAKRNRPSQVVSLNQAIATMENSISDEWTDSKSGERTCSSFAERFERFDQESDEEMIDVETMDSRQLLDHIGFSVDNPLLLTDIVDGFGNRLWRKRRQSLTRRERLLLSWHGFCFMVTHRRRYTFWFLDCAEKIKSNPDYLSPEAIIREIEGMIVGAGLIKTVPSGTVIWRARLHPSSKPLSTADCFTSPPTCFANQPNRMSPAGVPMFYGADTLRTAFLELVHPKHRAVKSQVVSGAQFKSLMPLNILDLTSIPAPPSYFSLNGPSLRHIFSFLREFARAISQPLKKGKHPDITYVPSQVFTEYVCHIMKGPGGVAIHGIRYSSSRNRKPCWVIFAQQQHCLPGPCREQMLSFVDGSINTVPVS